ncbi:MAG: cupin domain-containing protein [Arenicella sp.]
MAKQFRLFTIIIILLTGIMTVFAKGIAPEKTHGLEVYPIYLNGLGAQIPAMEGFEFRARKIVVLPGAATAEHSHADRPGIVYVEKGTLNEYRGETMRKVNAGDTWIEKVETVHWFENVSQEAAIILAFDLVPTAE